MRHEWAECSSVSCEGSLQGQGRQLRCVFDRCSKLWETDGNKHSAPPSILSSAAASRQTLAAFLLVIT